jgi:enoyl-CoA hydratase/carnithine racemase
MPETGIGFFPDIGASFFLDRCPGQLGIYLGLTGSRLKSDDTLYAGLLDCIIESSNIPTLIESLANTDMNEQTSTRVMQCLQEFKSTTAQPSHLAEQQTLIDRCFNAETIEDILNRLNQESSDFAQNTVSNLLKKSPTSLKVTLALLRKTKQVTIEQCLQMDYRLVKHFLRNHDFSEGVRAVVIDKDNQPQWQPKKLEDITDEAVSKYFEPLGQELEFVHNSSPQKLTSRNE